MHRLTLTPLLAVGTKDFASVTAYQAVCIALEFDDHLEEKLTRNVCTLRFPPVTFENFRVTLDARHHLLTSLSCCVRCSVCGVSSSWLLLATGLMQKLRRWVGKKVCCGPGYCLTLRFLFVYVVKKWSFWRYKYTLVLSLDCSCVVSFLLTASAPDWRSLLSHDCCLRWEGFGIKFDNLTFSSSLSTEGLTCSAVNSACSCR